VLDAGRTCAVNETAQHQLELIRRITTTLSTGAGRAWLFGGWGVDAPARRAAA